MRRGRTGEGEGGEAGWHLVKHTTPSPGGWRGGWRRGEGAELFIIADLSRIHCPVILCPQTIPNCPPNLFAVPQTPFLYSVPWASPPSEHSSWVELTGPADPLLIRGAVQLPGSDFGAGGAASGDAVLVLLEASPRLSGAEVCGGEEVWIVWGEVWGDAVLVLLEASPRLSGAEVCGGVDSVGGGVGGRGDGDAGGFPQAVGRRGVVGGGGVDSVGGETVGDTVLGGSQRCPSQASTGRGMRSGGGMDSMGGVMVHLAKDTVFPSDMPPPITPTHHLFRA